MAPGRPVASAPAVLREDGDLAALDAAWDAPATFAYLPARASVDEAWVREQLLALPPALHTGHFALLTSGSTGRPRLVVGRRDRAEALARAIHVAQDDEPVREAIQLLPLSYSFSFVNGWLWARTHGRRLVPTDGLADPAALAVVLERASAGMLCLVGIQATLLADAFAGRAFPGVVRVHFAGGRFPHGELDRLRALFPEAAVTNNFGCAEALPRLTCRPAGLTDDPADVGTPLPGVALRTAADGALEFRSPFGAVALADADGVRLVPPDGWLPTGDVGEAGEDGRWRVLGRVHEVFKRHGEKVLVPAVLDAVAATWDGEAAAYRAEDRRGESGWVLVLAPAADRDGVRAVLRVLRERFPRSQWPLRIETSEALPRLGNGKVDAGRLAGAIVWDQRA